MFECFGGLLWFGLFWFGFNDCGVGFGWASLLTAQFAYKACSRDLCLVLKPEQVSTSCPSLLMSSADRPQAPRGCWANVGFMSNQEADFCVVCGVKATTTPIPCALCMLRAQQNGTDTELPLEQTSGQDHRRAESRVTSLYFDSSYKYVYFLKALFCSKPQSFKV